jgi:hypothetical protein
LGQLLTRNPASELRANEQTSKSNPTHKLVQESSDHNDTKNLTSEFASKQDAAAKN